MTNVMMVAIATIIINIAAAVVGPIISAPRNNHYLFS
jgi:hypothetical protein